MNPSAPRRLRVLHLESREPDHALVVEHLLRAGLDVQARRVGSAAEFEAALAQGGWDVVLSDGQLPGYGGLQALAHLRSRGHLLPFLLVSAELGEDVAVQAMRLGASDCLPKARLERLGSATLQALAAQEAVSAKARSDTALQQSERRLHELARHLQSSVERERAAIAREIHDEVGSALTALRFDLAWIVRHVPDAAVQRRLSASIETLNRAMEASQRIMLDLRPAILEQGLVAALQWKSHRFERRTGIETVFRSSHEQLPGLPAGVPLVVYRSAQEALKNIARHAQARRVQLDLTLAGGVLSLEVGDDGRGLERADLAKAGAFGLRSLQERAATVGGWIEISGGSGGTTLILSIPIGPSEELNDTGFAGRPLREGETGPARGAGRADDPPWGN